MNNPNHHHPTPRNASKHFTGLLPGLCGNALLSPPPAECIRCFAADPKAVNDGGGYDCRCAACGHEWRERFHE